MIGVYPNFAPATKYKKLMDVICHRPGAGSSAAGPPASRGRITAEVRHVDTTERDVMALVTTGLRNKEIAYALGTSEKTIKAHRTHIMRKMQAASFAELVRMVVMVETCEPQTAQLHLSPARLIKNRPFSISNSG
jgi:FixJ family two-component response regulator